ncbi:unnamed protein product, partial [marine sediment metagenome]
GVPLLAPKVCYVAQSCIHTPDYMQKYISVQIAETIAVAVSLSATIKNTSYAYVSFTSIGLNLI